MVLPLSALVLGSFPGLAAAPAPDAVLSDTVRAQIANEGRARVIVELRLPSGAFVPEGHLRTGAAAATQRGDIASAGRQVLSRLRGRSHRVVHRFETVPYMTLEVGPDALAELAAASSHVQRVVEDMLYQPALPTSVPLIGASQAWSAGFDGTGMTVAILDTGVQKTHPFLAGKVVEEACFSSATSVSFCPNHSTSQYGPGSGVDCSGNALCSHGTHVAGIAAGNGAQAGVPFSGVAKGATIMAVQIFSNFGTSITTSTTDIMRGLERVYGCSTGTANPPCSGTYNFAAVNLSVGAGQYVTNCDGDPVKGPIDQLRSVGIATVVASGNNGSPNSLATPACISSAVSVGSTTNPGNIVSDFSNVAPFLSLFAPGDPVLSSAPYSPSSSSCWASGYSGFFYCRGTSMAAPHVTGAFAILKQSAPGASVTALLNAFQQTGLPITASTRRIQIPDFNAGGRADILWRHVSGTVAVWLMNGTAVVSTAVVGSAPADWTIVAIGDFNGDGKADILWRSSAGLLSIWLMNGASLVAVGSPGTVPLDWTVQGVGDLNGDGKADILWRDAAGVVAVWFMNGAGVASSAVIAAVPLAWTIWGIGDFNGDGKADILWRNQAGVVSVWLMNGATIAASGSVAGVGANWTIRGVGDFNGDGKADILWRDDSGVVAIWFMNGTSISSSGVVATVSLDWTIGGGGDFDGDGKRDILWRNATGAVAIWLMNGAAIAGSGVVRNVPTDWQVQ